MKRKFSHYLGNIVDKIIVPIKKYSTKYVPKPNNPELINFQDNINNLYSQPTKKRKRDDIWVSATKTKNYMIHDTLVDYLELQSKNFRTYNPNKFKINKKAKNKNITKTTNYLFEKGYEFERYVINYLKEKYIVYCLDSNYNLENVKKTKELINKQVPIIFQGSLKNDDNNTFGVCDLLVRSDYINKLTKENYLNEDEIYYNDKLFYYVIDIKWSTIPLASNQKNILNKDLIPAHKSQIWIYNRCLGLIQGITPRYGFILGRNWNYDGERGIGVFDKLGVIDYYYYDKNFPQESINAVNWYKDVAKNGKNWDIKNPHRSELYPNMCKDSYIWNEKKKELALKIGEISLLWYCGYKHRNRGLEKGIDSWKLRRCNSEILNVDLGKRKIVDLMIKINRNNKDKIYPKKITNNLYNWRKEVNEIFVDFEIIPNIFDDFSNFPKQKNSNYLFMIGVGYIIKSKIIYKSFIVNELNLEEEYRIMNEFIEFWNDRKRPKIYFWSAEKKFWEYYSNRQFTENNSLHSKEKNNIIVNWYIPDKKLCDLSNFFRETPIIIKNCFGFKLKEIAKCMNDMGMIKIKNDSGIDNGMDAVINANNIYKSKNIKKEIKNVEKYNKFDVEIMYYILSYLRKNH